MRAIIWGNIQRVLLLRIVSSKLVRDQPEVISDVNCSYIISSEIWISLVESRHLSFSGHWTLMAEIPLGRSCSSLILAMVWASWNWRLQAVPQRSIQIQPFLYLMIWEETNCRNEEMSCCGKVIVGQPLSIQMTASWTNERACNRD